MTLKNKRNLLFVSAFLFCLFSYFYLCSASNIIGYNKIAYLKLWTLHLLLFIPILVANFYVFKEIFKSRKHFLLAVIPFVLSFLILELALSVVYKLLPNSLYIYTSVGEYLRKNHEINIYYMDWGGWMGAQFFYPLQLLNVFLLYISKKIFKLS